MLPASMRRAAIAAASLLLVIATPVTAGAAPKATKHLNRDGSIPAEWNLPTPVLPSEDATPASAGGDGDGANTVSFAQCDDGDMLCAFDTLSTGHTGIWKDALYTGLYSYCVWSANTAPLDGVQRERPVKYRGYDYCYAQWVPAKSAYGPAVVNWCAAQVGEDYDIASAKTDYTRWYCSKLAWAGWKVKTGADLDANGGYWVTPADLVNDSQTSTFAFGD